MARKKEPIDYVKIIKIIDPVIQTLLIILVFFIFDKKGTRYHQVMLYLIRFQLVSVVLNLFLKFSKKLVYERVLSFIAMSVWLFGYIRIYAERRIDEKFATVILGKGFTQIGLLDTIFMLTGLAIAFWYFSISFREVNFLLQRRRKNKYIK